MKRILIPLLVAGSLALVACDEDNATGLSSDLIPLNPQTVTVLLPWDEVGVETGSFSGFGSAADLNRGMVAKDFAEVFNAKALARFGGFEETVTVFGADGTLVTSASDFRRGRVVLRVRRTDGPQDPALIRARSTDIAWDRATANWEAAADSLDELRLWGLPGAADADSVGAAMWDPAAPDSVIIELDSAIVARFLDASVEERGMVLETEGEGLRMTFSSISMRLDLRPDLAPDTTIEVVANAPLLTTIFDPSVVQEEGEILVGGAPATRATLRLAIPASVDEPNSVCQRVVCPLALEPDRINVASLILSTAESRAELAPMDSLRLDFRAVLAPEALPKSPLSQSFIVNQFGHLAIAPEAFVDAVGEEVSFPLTDFVRDQLRGETRTGRDPAEVVTLLGFLEPTSFDFATFAAPGEPGAPFVRVVLTLADSVLIR